MDSWRWLLMPLLLLSALGCRAGRLTEPLERENRHLEDVIYELEDQLHELQAQLDSCHRENATLRRQLASGETSTNGGRVPADDLRPPRTELGEPTFELPLPRRSIETEQPAPPFQGPPLISPPSDDRPDGILPQHGPEELFESDEFFEAEQISPTSALQAITKKKVSQPITDARVAKITLNRQLTGGHNRDSHPGDDGVMVVVEPRNAAGQVLRAAGELSIVVLDPKLEGAERRIARWDFDAEETEKLFKKTLLGEGIHLALPWPGEPPQNTQLMLLVRFRIGEQEHIADQSIRVKLPVQHDGVEPASFESAEVEAQAVQPASWQARAGSEHSATRIDQAATPPEHTGSGSSTASGWTGARR